MASYKNNQGQQTELVKNSLIRYIRDSKLSVGDKLPSQAELREKLNVGSETIRRAVYFLRDSGILELRGNKGIFLSSENADGSFGRQIGMVCMRIPSYIYGVNLIQCLELQLHDHGCQPVIFLREDAAMKKRDSLSLFSGLERNIRQNLIDGLMTTVPLDDEAMKLCADHNVPVCYYGDYAEFPYRVTIDSSFLLDGLRELLRLDCHRPAMITSNHSQQIKDLFQGVAGPVLGKKQWEKYLFLTGEDPQSPKIPEQMWKCWEKIAQKIIAMPEDERPDGLFIPDDFMTVYIAGCLLKNGISMPRLIAQRSAQIPIGMPFDLAGYFESDIMEIARLSIDLLLRQINEPELVPTQLCYKPKYITLSR